MKQIKKDNQGGMFVLSDLTEVNDLVRQLRNKPLNEYAAEPVQATNRKSQDGMLEEIANRLQAIEEKLNQQEGFQAQAINSLTEKFAAMLRQTLEYLDRDRKKAQAELRAELASIDAGLIREIRAIQDKLGNTERQLSWWQRMFEVK